ncbi:PHOsphatase [Mortierella hygrophila]|uniref:Multiple inositol polyphosphate phosphatase 1 n=1 Tax=Mortierella hygrophila TaxID=979708 RepID=A0A9P6FAY3_9FUNG|nr:PHOsphatase [Mortierella hygrophila]
MSVAQKQDAAPGQFTAATTTTSKKSAILLPSVALMLALSCLFSPATVQAGPVDDAAAAKHSSSSPLFSLPPLNWIRTHLGTKSPYPHETRPVGHLKDTPKGYELVQLQLVCRHGTRYPSADKSVGFQKMTDRLKGIKLPGFEWIKDWPSETLYPPARGNLLSVQGDADLYQIGRRFAIRYKTLLDKYPYDADSYVFYSSPKSRSKQSGYGFSVGFFEGRLAEDSGSAYEKGVIGKRPPVQPVEISMLPLGLDKEMAMKYACPRWLESVDGQKAVERNNKEYEATFKPELAQRISTILSAGAKTPAAQFNLTVKDLGVIQNMCGFEISMHNTEKTWCRFLGLGLSSSKDGKSKKDGKDDKSSEAKDLFLKLEIADDLDDYYTYGPGVPFNRHLGCKLGTSLVESVEMALTEDRTGAQAPAAGGDDDDVPGVSRAVLKFGHSETIMLFSSMLGLYNKKGVPLTANMTSEQYENREFRASNFAPFSSNMAFEIYRPIAPKAPKLRRRQDAPAAAPEGLIRLLVNEVPMTLPGCGSNYFCEWSTFKKILQLTSSGCDFDGCCSSSGASGASASALEGGEVKAAFLKAFEKRADPVCLSIQPVA